MDGGNLRFANVPDSEILTIREYARPENTKKALNFGLKLLKGRKKVTDVPYLSSFRICLWKSQISSLYADPFAKLLLTLR